MKLGCKLGWLLSLVLAIGLVAMAYTFLVAGTTEPHADGRTVVLLSADERNKVLGEMRGLLETVQGITLAAIDGDMEEVQGLATAVGMAAASGESPALIRKLPLEFKTLGLGTHQAFDDLATLATVTNDPLEILGEMGKVMGNCTSCHAGYRLGIEGADREKP